MVYIVLFVYIALDLGYHPPPWSCLIQCVSFITKLAYIQYILNHQILMWHIELFNARVSVIPVKVCSYGCIYHCISWGVCIVNVSAIWTHNALLHFCTNRCRSMHQTVSYSIHCCWWGSILLKWFAANFYGEATYYKRPSITVNI